MSNPEVHQGSAENSLEKVQDAASERSNELLHSPEKTPEQPDANREKNSAERDIERVFSKEKGSAERKVKSLDTDGPALPRAASKKERDYAFKSTMKRVQSEMSPAEKTFSKVIHNKTVERVSDTVGSTVARPNAILAGSFSAFLLVSVVYVIARSMGYRLSGFETIFTFALGWSLGLIFDYARLMFRGRRS